MIFPFLWIDWLINYFGGFNLMKIEDIFISSITFTVNKKCVKNDLLWVACVWVCVLMAVRLIVQIEHTSRCNLPIRWIIKPFPLIDTAIYQRVNIWYVQYVCIQHTSVECVLQQYTENFQPNWDCIHMRKKSRTSFIFSAQFQLRIIFFRTFTYTHTYVPSLRLCLIVILTIIHAHISLNAYTIKRIYLMPLNCLSYIMDIRYDFKWGRWCVCVCIKLKSKVRHMFTICCCCWCHCFKPDENWCSLCL